MMANHSLDTIRAEIDDAFMPIHTDVAVLRAQLEGGFARLDAENAELRTRLATVERLLEGLISTWRQ